MGANDRRHALSWSELRLETRNARAWDGPIVEELRTNEYGCKSHSRILFRDAQLSASALLCFQLRLLAFGRGLNLGRAQHFAGGFGLDLARRHCLRGEHG